MRDAGRFRLIHNGADRAEREEQRGSFFATSDMKLNGYQEQCEAVGAR